MEAGAAREGGQRGSGGARRDGGHLRGQVFELGEFGEPFVGRGEVLNAEVDAGGEGVGVFGGDGVGADEFHLFDEAFLLRADKVVVGLGLLDAREALAEGGKALEARGKEAFFAVEQVWTWRDLLERINLSGERGSLGFEGGDEGRDLFFALGLEVNLERLLDVEHAQIGPGEFVEFAAAGVEIEAGVLGFGGGGFDVATDGDELRVAGAATGGERGEEGFVLFLKRDELGGCCGGVDGLGAGIDGAAKEGEVGDETRPRA